MGRSKKYQMGFGPDTLVQQIEAIVVEETVGHG
jgi:hypothetical protein